MPKTAKPPAYRHYKPKNLAVVRIDGKDNYLGEYNCPESWRKYHELLAKRGSSTQLSLSHPDFRSIQPATGISLKRLCLSYVEFAEIDYLRDGKLSAEVDRIRYALRSLIKLYGDSLAVDFGPLALKQVREEFIRRGQSRGVVNANVSRIKRMFRWGAENQMIVAATYQAVATVNGLKKGRDAAKESQRVKPVDDTSVEQCIGYMPLPVAAMVRLQRLTGCRLGELCMLRPQDIDRTMEIWCFRPQAHKTEHHDIERRIYFGPKAQKILNPWLDREPATFCFSPREEVARQQSAKHARRKTPLHYGNRPGKNRKSAPRRAPKECYSTASYRRAVERACEKAKIECWTPNQLRHARATELRRLHGLDAAQVVLGHSDAFVTEIYAERDFARAESIMREIG